MKYYCDGSTFKNGQEGQDSSILVLKPDNMTHREHIGDVSINYAELFALKRAAEYAKQGDTLITDSQLAFNWLSKTFKPNKNNVHLMDLIYLIKGIVWDKHLVLENVPREQNKAGIEIENNPFYQSSYESEKYGFEY